MLSRSVRVCLCDGLEIVSNIHTVRASIPPKINPNSPTEDWSFAENDHRTLIDQQSQLLVRANRTSPSQHFHLLLELSQYCQSTATQEKCEIGSGWVMVPLDDHKPPLVTDTKNYNALLNGGHMDEPGVLLDPQYLTLQSNGLSGAIDRLKRARLKFSLESRESDIDVAYDNLPIQPLVVPTNLIKPLVYYRNELAFQFHKRHHPTGLCTTPIDSIFLSTFFEALAQPDLIASLRRLYALRKKRHLNSSASVQQQREEFIRTYQLFIYPLLHYRDLPPYDFHDLAVQNERRRIINEMNQRQIPIKKAPPQDTAAVFLDPTLTDRWTPFTTHEISFSLQKFVPSFPSNVEA